MPDAKFRGEDMKRDPMYDDDSGDEKVTDATGQTMNVFDAMAVAAGQLLLKMSPEDLAKMAAERLSNDEIVVWATDDAGRFYPYEG